jgi:putative addiction module component (TIGR02574 family)
MGETAERLKSELAMLPPQERAELARYLIRSLDTAETEDVEAAWDTELARRAEEILSGHATGERAEEVYAQLRERHE